MYEAVKVDVRWLLLGEQLLRFCKFASKDTNDVTGEWTDPDFMTNMFGHVPRCYLRYMYHPQSQIHLPLVLIWGVGARVGCDGEGE